MKGEGEFKRRIRQYEEGSHLEGHRAYENVTEWIDEAKKEFPELDAPRCGEWNWIGLANRRKEWFKKWFGE